MATRITPSGELKHRINLQHKVVTTDPTTTEMVVTYVTYATRWAKIEGLTPREYTIAKSYASNTNGKITIRFISGVKSTDRVHYYDSKSKIDRYYEITGNPISPLENYDDLILWVNESGREIT